MTQEPDYYRLLGVSQDATFEEIRNAYFDAARRLHPDVNVEPSAKEQFLVVQKAYDVISNPARRLVYDKKQASQYQPEGITVNLQYSAPSLLVLDEPQLIYCLVEILSTSEASSENMPPLNICLVIDRSNSMKGDRIETVKANIIELLNRLSKHDILSIVAFSDRAEVVLPPSQVVDVSRVEQLINLVNTGGGTEIYQGLKTGVAQLELLGNASEIRHLILLTDGHTYGDENDCVELSRQAVQQGITISALGIGHEWNDQFLDQIASISGGNTFYISSPRDLKKYLDQKVKAIEYVHARGVAYEFSIGPDVQLHYAFRLSPDLGPLSLSSPMVLGNLQYSRSITALLEFQVAPHLLQKGLATLAHGKIRANIAADNRVIRHAVDLERPVSTQYNLGHPPAAIVEAMSKLTLYRMQEHAKEQLDAGDILGATRRLQYLASNLLAGGDRELAHVVLVEAEHIKQSHRFSEDGDKRIKYGTRALLLPDGLEQENL
ncbi:MAG: VWA domain-containing protein [Anaerolineaceae bacterium]|nr:VWA domain-containing protein [Anaerolineaceae bacterium]